MEQYAVVNAEGRLVSYGAKAEIEQIVARWNAAAPAFSDGPYSVARVVLEPIPDPPPNPGEQRVWARQDPNGNLYDPFCTKPAHDTRPGWHLWSAVIPADAWELVEGQ